MHEYEYENEYILVPQLDYLAYDVKGYEINRSTSLISYLNDSSS